MTQAQTDFALGIYAFNLRSQTVEKEARSPDYYRGWTWAWGRSDERRGEICAFPDDPDYSAGYHNQLTELHHELPTAA